MTVSRSRATRCAGAWPRTNSSPGVRRCGASLTSTESSSRAWKTCSEDVLDLRACPRAGHRPDPGAEPPDPKCPVVCLDESPLQLIGEVREPVPAAPGRPVRYDYEYRRCGTVNLFVVMDVHRPWRKVTVTERRTAQDYAARLRDLVDVDFPDAARIRVVQDNLSTHTPGSLYETFPAAEAHRIRERLEFHYTPKHASWLNMVEIEIGVLKGQCLDRRIDHP